MMKSYSIVFLAMIAGAQALSAQLLSVGVKGGVSFLDTASPNDESKRYSVGPSVELRLPANFALEADALYQRVGNTSRLLSASGISLATAGSLSAFLVTNSFTNRTRGNSWEFPLLGKYYLRSPTSPWQPFIATGYAFRTVGYHSSGNQLFIDNNGVAQAFPFNVRYRSELGVGVVAAAGVRFHAGRIAVLPEVRYTRWGSSDGILERNEARAFLGLNF